MNAMVSFRTNAVGNMSPRPTEREQARSSIISTFRAKLEGIQRALVQEQLQSMGADEAAKMAAAQAAQTKAADDGNNNGNSGAEPDRNELGRDAYLQLLVQQLSNQDPLEPVDNQQMIAQLAQFSSLEQMQHLNESFTGLHGTFETMSQNMDQLNFISAQGLLGKYVEGLDKDGKPMSGTVESVHLDGSMVILTVDGKPMPMSGVLGVATNRPAAEEAAKAAAKAAEKAAKQAAKEAAQQGQ